MPKVTDEHKEQRKMEIVDACEKIYTEKGFYGVTIKEISTATSFTRPAIYTYFETKDEILLALLIREYEKWCGALAYAVTQIDGNRASAAELLAHTLDGREMMLRLQNMNLYEIEENSRVEHLAQFKLCLQNALCLLTDAVKAYCPQASDKECDSFCIQFSGFLLGVYPFAFHTTKQIKAMELINMRPLHTTIYELVCQCLVKLLP